MESRECLAGHGVVEIASMLLVATDRFQMTMEEEAQRRRVPAVKLAAEEAVAAMSAMAAAGSLTERTTGDELASLVERMAAGRWKDRAA
jgi:hypothetical protein